MKSLSAFILLLCCFYSVSFSQVKVVIMGSSTAYGVGASTYANSWAGKIDSFYNRNAADGEDTVFYNIAFPGYDTYQEMPDGFVPPAGRPLPDQDYNVTKALSYNPNVVVISLPSNDISYGYSKAEMISNLRYMSSAILATGLTTCYITTPQPRNDFDQSHRDSLLSLVDSVNFSFGPFAINFWDGLVTTDGLSILKEEYRDPASLIHVNDLGHNLLFERVRDKPIFSIGGPVPLRLTNFKAQLQNNTVLLNWHTEGQGSHTSFDLQRSADAHFFETIFTQNVNDARQSADYATIDATPLNDKSFYRLKINENGRQSYSGVISITAHGKMLSVLNISVDNAGSTLTANIDVQKSQFANLIIINAAGAIVAKQKEYIAQPAAAIRLPVSNLSPGQYYLRIITEDGNHVTSSFRK